jgi:hypothetical protein
LIKIKLVSFFIFFFCHLQLSIIFNSYLHTTERVHN